MKKNHKETINGKNKKDKIIDAAFVLSMQVGFDNVSIKQIQQETGLAAGSIYYHFRDKNDILLNMLKKHLLGNFFHFKKNVENLDGSFMDKIRFIFEYKAHSFVNIGGDPIYNGQNFSYKVFFTFLVSIIHGHPEVRPLFYQLYDGLYLFLLELFQDAIDNKEIRDDVDVESLVMFFQTLLEGYINLWIIQPNFSFEKLIDVNLELMWELIKR